jgi:Uma2 family endonuclease
LTGDRHLALTLFKIVRDNSTMATLLKWTIQDYHQLIDQGLLDGKKVELLNGDIVTMPPEGPLHSYINQTSADYLRQKLKGLALVRESHPITLADSEPEPDIAVVKPLGSPYKERHPGADDIFWLIEIANSTLASDLNAKKQIYAVESIKEYWVVDLTQQQVFVFQDPVNGSYTKENIYSNGVISPQAFPNLKLVLKDLFQW